MENMRILFITDIHQNIEAVKKINFNDCDYIFCGGDLIDPIKPDIKKAMDVIDLMPSETFIVPGNCDKYIDLIEYMDNKLIMIHKKIIYNIDMPVIGIGYSRMLKEDLKVYRNYMLEDHSRIHYFSKNSKLAFILNFCGINIDNNKNVKTVSLDKAYESAGDFIDKFVSFDENEIKNFLSLIDNAEKGIILSHSPPYGALDKLDGLPHIGSHSVRYGITKFKPRIVLCGHFHELIGKSKINDTIIFNPGALKDYRYGVINFNKDNVEIEFKKI